ncbi:MAG: TraR/DksA family transcriptional regulator [Rhodobacterales bacterium]|nr:MAG: TraR/DksA family transcriptional regulator [Rhodobacterales bacterium]
MQAIKPVPLTTRRAMLEGRLIELGARLDVIDDELLSHHSADWEDLATERETDEVLEATAKAGLAEIPLIRAAIHRIADGSYGICASCGEPIPEGRLDALPWTPLCRSCAQ